MALETLKEAKTIRGYDVVHMDTLKEEYPEHFNPESGQMDYAWFEKEIRPKKFIYIRQDKNSLSFTLQNGPIKENGVNGCQVDCLIGAARRIIERLNENFPSEYNETAILYLKKALDALDARTKDRQKRGVEGFNKA